MPRKLVYKIGDSLIVKSSTGTQEVRVIDAITTREEKGKTHVTFESNKMALNESDIVGKCVVQKLAAARKAPAATAAKPRPKKVREVPAAA